MLHTLFGDLEGSEQYQVVSEVVTDTQIAFRLISLVCRDLDSRYLLPTQLMHHPQLLLRLLYHSPHATTIGATKVNIFRSVAYYCQRQLCNGSLQELLEDEVDILSDCFEAVS